MSAFVGLKILIETIAAAKSTEYEKVIAAAAKMDKPFGTYETATASSNDETMQNTRALPVIAQWQGGDVPGRLPKEASPGVTMIDLGRK